MSRPAAGTGSAIVRHFRVTRVEMDGRVRACIIAIVFAAAVQAGATTASSQDTPSSDAALPHCIGGSGDQQVVTGIIDAATVTLDDGGEVRLAGILPPRRPLTAASAVSGEPWAPERSALAALSNLALGASIEIFDTPAARDRYGRRIAHVVVRRNGERLWLQGELLQTGHARTYALSASETCLPEMLEREKRARLAEKGLWSNAAFSVRRAERPTLLSRLRSTFQIVEGTVVDIAEVGGNVYINFGRDWRTDFTAGVSRRRESRAAFQGFDVKSLKGERVRVRGWIDRRNGPYVELVHPAQIERVAKDTREPSAQADRPIDVPSNGSSGIVGDDDGAQATTKGERPATASPGAHEL